METGSPRRQSLHQEGQARRLRISEDLSKQKHEAGDEIHDRAESYAKVDAWNNSIGVPSVFLDNRPKLTPREKRARDLKNTPKVGIPLADEPPRKIKLFPPRKRSPPLERAPVLPSVAPPAPSSSNLARALPQKPEVIRITDSRGRQKVIRPNPHPQFASHPLAVSQVHRNYQRFLTASTSSRVF